MYITRFTYILSWEYNAHTFLSSGSVRRFSVMRIGQLGGELGRWAVEGNFSIEGVVKYTME